MYVFLDGSVGYAQSTHMQGITVIGHAYISVRIRDACIQHYLVDLVEHVYAGYISAITLDNVDQLVHTYIYTYNISTQISYNRLGYV